MGGHLHNPRGLANLVPFRLQETMQLDTAGLPNCGARTIMCPSKSGHAGAERFIRGGNLYSICTLLFCICSKP